MEQRDGIAWGVAGGIGRIELRRPDGVNALSTPMARALATAIDAVLAGSPRAILLSARGPIFCAGGDIEEFGRAGAGLEALVDEILAIVHPAIARLLEAPVPIVSAVGGPVGGAGIGLALAADFVLAAGSMKLRTGYAAIGLSPDLGTSCALARRIGSQRARQWLLLSDSFDAAQCLQAGAVDAVYPDAELPARAEALLARLAAGAPQSHAAIKTLCRRLEPGELQAQLALEHRLLRACAGTADAQQRIAAFVQARAARRPA